MPCSAALVRKRSAWYRIVAWGLAMGGIAIMMVPAGWAEERGGEGSLPGTQQLDWEGDLAARLLDSAHAFADQQLAASIDRRPQYWHRDFSSPTAYESSLAPQRARLSHILGLRDPRATDVRPRVVAPAGKDVPLATGQGYSIQEVAWDAVGLTIQGEGLMLVPDQSPRALVIFVPDADQTPEMLCGLTEGIDPSAQTPLQLAEQGCLVVVPALVDRSRGPYRFTQREFLYRAAFEVGRQLIGYELQEILAIVDGFSAYRQESGQNSLKIALWGYGEGGMLALYAAALDPRIAVTCVSGYFGDRNDLWQQPVDRNVFGLLEQFGDAEIATMVAPRSLIVEACKHPTFELPPGTGGAPAKLTTPAAEEVEREVERSRMLLDPAWRTWLQRVGRAGATWGSEEAWQAFAQGCQLLSQQRPQVKPPHRIRETTDSTARQARLVTQFDRHSQEVLRGSQYVRQAYFKELKTDNLETYARSVERYRDDFRQEVIGHFDIPLAPPAPRTRQFQETDKVVYHEVVLDTFPGLFAYGILCLPKDLKPGERRPVVVCQHGLEGRPQMVIGEPGHEYYKAFATQLAERGFITFAPQNLYIFEDRFRSLQRKLYPLKKTLFSLIVPQHQQIVDWLQSQPFVDPSRVAFYGLSYGGKTAMRVPPLVTDYCLSICSADFNEWVDKNASTSNPRSYVRSGEYEIFEWDLGSTFNYAEMAALIAPRPFMVERGHFDGVADDWTVGWEFAKVQNLYQARLNLPDRCQIEWFVGPHTINGIGTFDFLHRHLAWPQP